MAEWIVKYWVEVLFGLICAGLGCFFKIFFNLLKKQYADQQKDLIEKFDEKLRSHADLFNNNLKIQKTVIEETLNSRDEAIFSKEDELYKKSLEADNTIKSDIETIQQQFLSMRKGLLSIQGRAFKNECRNLLSIDQNGEPHIITLEEFESITEEHSIYKELGGNHMGDTLFNAVVVKYQQQLKN